MPKPKAFIVTTVASTIDQFCMDNIETLLEKGYEVAVAANFQEGNNTSRERLLVFQQELEEQSVAIYDVAFSRSVTSAKNLKAYQEIKRLMEREQFDLVHCHTPIASIICRLAGRKLRKQGLKMLYTAHGFHFFRGAPALNWMLYYPVEWWCSRYTDALITINQEDFALAKKRMRVAQNHIYRIPGVGIETAKWDASLYDREAIRESLGIQDGQTLLLSVGELNSNKNHEVIIRALHQLANPDYRYMIAGQGDLGETLGALIKELGMEKQVQLLGYRRDIPQLCAAADLFCFPSRREGLGLAALEAMSMGLPLVASNLHGIRDYLIDGVTGIGCPPDSVDAYAAAIGKLCGDEALRRRMAEKNPEFVKQFDVSVVHRQMSEIYEEMLPGNTVETAAV